jgi:hypothetical protein
MDYFIGAIAATIVLFVFAQCAGRKLIRDARARFKDPEYRLDLELATIDDITSELERRRYCFFLVCFRQGQEHLQHITGNGDPSKCPQFLRMLADEMEEHCDG